MHLLEGARSGVRGVPSLERPVDRFDAAERLVVGRKIDDLLSVEHVGGADVDFLEGVEHVELRQSELGHAVDNERVAKRDKVEPSAAPLAARRGSELVTDPAELLAGFIEQFRRERTVAHARHIRLADPDDVLDIVRRDARARRRPAGCRVR